MKHGLLAGPFKYSLRVIKDIVHGFGAHRGLNLHLIAVVEVSV